MVSAGKVWSFLQQPQGPSTQREFEPTQLFLSALSKCLMFLTLLTSESVTSDTCLMFTGSHLCRYVDITRYVDNVDISVDMLPRVLVIVAEVIPVTAAAGAVVALPHLCR